MAKILRTPTRAEGGITDEEKAKMMVKQIRGGE
jgi:hypothetical protein